MNGIKIGFSEDQQNVVLTASPKELESELDINQVYEYLITSGFGEVYLSESSLKKVCDKVNHYFKTNDATVVQQIVGERRNAEVAFIIHNDELSASLSITAPFGGHTPSLNAVITLAKKSGIQRGISRKRIKHLLAKLDGVEPGNVLEEEIAKGLPPKDGKSSHIKPLVPNALDRVLKPQVGKDGTTDLRNLGNVICVKPKTPVAKRLPPSKGRTGYTVTNKPIDALEGKWLPIKMGSGTEISVDDENLILASISGMPKFLDLTMSVDDTFTCKGVNVGTGHVKYDGAVLVNGDVAEKMRIEASGDVTINGFVESGYIEAGGDIIVTEGAMGKDTGDLEDNTCMLKAKGSIHLQHGQGVCIICDGSVTVGRQLAYSKVTCGGSVTVGQKGKDNGTLFACDIQSQGQVSAGTLGAVSGSTLTIDFSGGFETLSERIDAVEGLLKQLRENNSRHKKKMKLLSTKTVPKELLNRIADTKEVLNNETALLKWLEAKAIRLKDTKENYQNNVKIVATKKLYSGVSVKLINKNWRSEREHDRAIVLYKGRDWVYEPITT